MFNFTIKSFKELSVDELYKILQLRENVFVIEQNCVYNDIDNLDQHCFHIYAIEEDTSEITAYARLVPSNLKFDVPSIGRVISDKKYRGQGLGKALMLKSIEEIQHLYQTKSIKISAQMYLFNFYGSLGFKPISEPYDEDGIEHIDMSLKI